MKKHNSPLACSKTSQKRPAEDYQDNLGTEERKKKKNKWKEKSKHRFLDILLTSKFKCFHNSFKYVGQSLIRTIEINTQGITTMEPSAIKLFNCVSSQNTSEWFLLRQQKCIRKFTLLSNNISRKICKGNVIFDING